MAYGMIRTDVAREMISKGIEKSSPTREDVANPYVPLSEVELVLSEMDVPLEKRNEIMKGFHMKDESLLSAQKKFSGNLEDTVKEFEDMLKESFRTAFYSCYDEVMPFNDSGLILVLYHNSSDKKYCVEGSYSFIIAKKAEKDQYRFGSRVAKINVSENLPWKPNLFEKMGQKVNRIFDRNEHYMGTILSNPKFYYVINHEYYSNNDHRNNVIENESQGTRRFFENVISVIRGDDVVKKSTTIEVLE